MSNVDGTAELYLSLRSGSSNSLFAGFKPSQDAVKVKTAPLDTYVANHNRVPNVVKIDVEGIQYSVLRGAINTISAYRP